MNILLVDDHEIIKKGTEERLSKIFTNVTCYFANNIREVIYLINNHSIDLILCDLEFKNDANTTGFTVAENILKFEPRIKLIAFTNYNSYRIMQKALESGFHSFVYKGASFNEFENTITKTLQTNTVYESQTMKDLRKNRKQFLRTVFADSLYGISSLSDREIELILLSKKITNRQELANIMNVLPSTIDTYYKRIIEKLALNDRKEITMFANEFSDEIRKK